MIKSTRLLLSIVIVSMTILLTFTTSCNHTRLINISKKEISELDTVYYQKFVQKLWDTEWIFYDKQICQMRTELIGKKTYTGTWKEAQDTLTVNFFYGKKVANERKFYINPENNKLIEIRN